MSCKSLLYMVGMFVFVPVWIGLLWTDFLKIRERASQLLHAWVLGFATMLATAQLVLVPFVMMQKTLTQALLLWRSEVLLYDGVPILAVFFSSADGSTQGAGDVWLNDLPYLQKVESPEDEALVPNYYSTASFTAEEFKSLVLRAYPNADLSGDASTWVRDIVRNDSDYVASVTVGGVKMRGNDLRTLLSLRSPSFTVDCSDGTLTFHVTGYGHGVGMSQYGANALAKEGYSAEEIVQHYFSGAVVGYYDAA